MSSLRSQLIRLAAANPELRADLLPLLKEDANPASLDQNRPESYYGLAPRGIQAGRRREDPNRVVLMVTGAITGPMVVNVTNGINRRHEYDGTPEGLAATLQTVATSAIRFQSMDFLDGPELNVVQAPRVPARLVDTVMDIRQRAETAGRTMPVYVALRDNTMGLEWAILPRAPKLAGCEKLPAGGMRDNCEKKQEEGKENKGKEAGTRRKAHGPVAIRQPEVMLYAIDADASAKGQSKFYEMKVVPFGTLVDVVTPKVLKEKNFRQGTQGFVLLKRWGRLTDTGGAGRVDGLNEYFDREADARAAMEDQKRSKMRGSGSAAYQDVSRSREYPIGLGGAGFGWGGQQACVYVPELRELRHAVTSMNATIAKTGPAMEGLARKNSDVGRRVTSLLGEVQSSMQNLQKYLDDQMRYCD
jgi:predicted DNA-binding WGR domain protein